ncbi:membrane protein [Streptococcus equi subsp. zooepidemicus Sz35]|uniref:Membrane protein n=1 Tax=Streptococcus equi subsp. zooepidemicus TaxID=40041 RepID=A0A7Z8ZXD8_STRSZ|nr:SagF family protein [Streptococcus equi]KIS21115.1 membrane protein [Streptococcus equi subsp. zooepidemicus Sz35]VEF08167.1 membrane protein [Streptococcus equi subsp. zooepidemicus]HEK9984286.1 streptolysin associated protein SagF [Streptococcus equi subsp. zooepidemicus]HEL0659793.1 streptolysin associated protein SagF [Streptococcus equi subsp. zooepidemicus]HEL0754341.1 streptolysin associated protein SagF [Streptococcus equi subsp. zooepidemicus]
MIIILALLSFLILVTLFLTSHKRRRLVRWHLRHIRAMSYQQWLDLLLGLIQLGLVLVCLLFSDALALDGLLTFLGRVSFGWEIICYVLLYSIALVELTLLVLVLLFDLMLKKDSRLLLGKMTWLAFKPDRAAASFLLLSLVTLVDAFCYLGLCLFLGKDSVAGLTLVVLGYALVKACRYSGWLQQLLAICLFSVIGVWCVTAALLYGWLIGSLLLTLTYLLISFKEQR